MKNIILTYLFSSLFFIVCVNGNTETINNDQFYNVENPLYELNWMTYLIDIYGNNTLEREIFKCTYKEQEGFPIDLYVGYPVGLLEFYDHVGNVICEFSGFDGRNTCPGFKNSISDMELIYSDSNTVLNNDTIYCITNPLQELKWLSELVEGVKDNPVKVEIYKCIYNYQEGFLIDKCVGCPDGLIEFYNCEGSVICEFGGFNGRNTCPDFESSVLNMELIWTNDDTTTVTYYVKGNPEIQCYLNHGSLVVKFSGKADPLYNLSVSTLDGRTIHSGNYNTWNLRLNNLGLKPKRLYLVSIQDSKQKMVYKLFNY